MTEAREPIDRRMPWSRLRRAWDRLVVELQDWRSAYAQRRAALEASLAPTITELHGCTTFTQLGAMSSSMAQSLLPIEPRTTWRCQRHATSLVNGDIYQGRNPR